MEYNPEFPRLGPIIWELSPEVFDSFDDDDIRTLVLESLAAEGIAADGVLFCGFEVEGEVAQELRRHRRTTFAMSIEEWLHNSEVNARQTPVGYMDGFVGMACIGVYDRNKLVDADGMAIDDTAALKHAVEGQSVQDALIGVFIFQK